jgi:DNA-binding transcriptional MocR family regulator
MDTSLQPIDLTKAFPPTSAVIDGAVSQTFRRLAMDCDLGSRIRLNRSAGNWTDRAAGAAWLSCRFSTPPPADRVIITNGTQSALALILQSLAVPGDLIVSERLTYAVLKQIVTRLRMRLQGIPVDERGLVPEAFEAVCRDQSPKALYCNPTVHNPTTAVMPETRRTAIANIARRYGVCIIEDDVIGALHGPDPRPIAAIAPDVTWYCMSLSKCFAMGLRLAYVVAPSQTAAVNLLQPVQNLSSWMPSSLCLMVVADWIETELGHQIARAIQNEIAERQRMAASLLRATDYATAPGALHIWLRLPPTFTAPAFEQAAARVKVGIRPSNVFLVDNSPAPDAVRISLTTPTHRTELETGLKRIAALMGATSVAY